jgi:hypothetical protein
MKPRAAFHPHPTLQKNQGKPPAVKPRPLPGKNNPPKDEEKKKLKPRF